MKPKKFPTAEKQEDLFRSQVADIINTSHCLVKLSRVVNWEELEKTFGETFCDDNGRPGVSIRLIVALH